MDRPRYPPQSATSAPQRILRVPRAPYRHAAPSGPWPWQNLDDPIPSETPRNQHTHDTTPNNDCEACQWSNYPESRFPNWRADQVERSGMKLKIPGVEREADKCILHTINVTHNGHFGDPETYDVSDAQAENQFRGILENPEKANDKPFRLRAFFAEDLTLKAMQLLGDGFIIEPFFWTSSVNWIPSRYQENPEPGKGDHITVTLKFPRAQRLDETSRFPFTESERDLSRGQVIDTQRPLPLESKDEKGYPVKHIIITDLLSLHLLRSSEQNILISYHPQNDYHTTTADALAKRVYLAGQSVYWKNIFERSNDPTLILLAVLWYPLYAWDESFETLWNHICDLELKVIETKNMELTQELHKIRAHLLHYESLLEDFEKCVRFVLDTPNLALDDPEIAAKTQEIMQRECDNLLAQIERLKSSRSLWDKRLKNVMHLVFSRVNIQDSDHMKKLTAAAVRDSAAMKQVSYLTMIFLPASFIAACFGMNIKELNDSKGNLPHYFEVAIPLTIVTAWVIIAFQSKWNESYDVDNKNEKSKSLWRRFLWPYDYAARYYRDRHERRRKAFENPSDMTLTAVA